MNLRTEAFGALAATLLSILIKAAGIYNEQIVGVKFAALIGFSIYLGGLIIRLPSELVPTPLRRLLRPISVVTLLLLSTAVSTIALRGIPIQGSIIIVLVLVGTAMMLPIILVKIANLRALTHETEVDEINEVDDIDPPEPIFGKPPKYVPLQAPPPENVPIPVISTSGGAVVNASQTNYTFSPPKPTENKVDPVPFVTN